MQITMTGEYATRAMIHLAGLPPGGTSQISEISEAWDIPESFLRKIITHLAKTGLIVSQRGIGGGVHLARPASEMTLLDVLQAVEGPMFLSKCLISTTFCTSTDWCAVHDLWFDAQERLRETLSSSSLAQLAAQSSAKRAVLKEGAAVLVDISGVTPVIA